VNIANVVFAFSRTEGPFDMPLLPREHGAYGQIAFPLITAFGVAGLSAGGSLLAIAIVAGFLAHEPAAILLGLRGARARREQQAVAARWAGACLVAATAAAAAGLAMTPPPARWSFTLPLVPAVWLGLRMATGREKSWQGEVAAAMAFSAAAVPICLAAGAPLRIGMAVAVPFALLFVAGTLAVRVVILKVRGGGDPRAATATRRAVFTVAGIGTATLVELAAANLISFAVVGTAVAGLLIVSGIAAYPPSPLQLRSLGWTLVGLSTLIAVTVITTVR
jgi:hypothetical protein